MMKTEQRSAGLEQLVASRLRAMYYNWLACSLMLIIAIGSQVSHDDDSGLLDSEMESGIDHEATLDAPVQNVDSKRPLSTRLDQSPRTITLPPWKQIEAIAVDSAGGVWVTTEGVPAKLGRLVQGAASEPESRHLE